MLSVVCHLLRLRNQVPASHILDIWYAYLHHWQPLYSQHVKFPTTYTNNIVDIRTFENRTTQFFQNLQSYLLFLKKRMCVQYNFFGRELSSVNARS